MEAEERQQQLLLLLLCHPLMRTCMGLPSLRMKFSTVLSHTLSLPGRKKTTNNRYGNNNGKIKEITRAEREGEYDDDDDYDDGKQNQGLTSFHSFGTKLGLGFKAYN
jgi:hypothetical protein